MHCWLELLKEDEVTGNWLKDICFAVCDPRYDGSYEIFNEFWVETEANSESKANAPATVY